MMSYFRIVLRMDTTLIVALCWTGEKSSLMSYFKIVLRMDTMLIVATLLDRRKVRLLFLKFGEE
jgi:hypothetical protein